MRKIVVISMITLDSVLQAPGGPTEDTSGGFKYGGWTAPLTDDEAMKMIIDDMVGHPYDLLLGRTTYDIWKAYWPLHKDHPIGDAFDKATKYVVSTHPIENAWEKTVLLRNVEEIKKLKNEEPPFDDAQGKEIQVQGSGKLIQTLLKENLVDEMRLRIYPITLGQGKRLFDGGQIPAAFTLEGCSHSPSGVIFANYKRAGEVKTGSF